MERRLNIALFMGMIENEFSHAICEGAMLGARELDANLFVLPAGIIDAQYDDVQNNYYRYQYNTLFSCKDSKDLDAVIIEYGTVTSFLNEDRKQKFIDSFGNVPVILLHGESEGASSVCIDNRSGLQDVIEQLITERGCNKIGFVSGPKGNLDAEERLDVYKQVLGNHSIEVDEDLIIYGNFSEYCDDIVEDLLVRHSDIQAIVFANDSMAIGGYRAIEKRGLTPGKDIYVTGFDDTPAALILEPHLTTVRADSKELAYAAVMQCPKIIDGEQVHMLVKSKPVFRESSGLIDMQQYDDNVDDLKANDRDQIVQRMLAEFILDSFHNYFEMSERREMKDVMERFIRYFLTLASPDGELVLEHSRFMEEFSLYNQLYFKGFVDLNAYLAIISRIYQYVKNCLKRESDCLRLSETLGDATGQFMMRITRNKIAQSEQDKQFEIQLSTITRDMLQFSKEERRQYDTVISKFRKLGFSSSYIMTYGDGISHTRSEEWKMPNHLYMKAQHNMDDVHLYKGKEKKVRSSEIFSQKYMPNNRRFDMLVMPLFSGEIQYGLIFTETDIEYFRYSVQMASQISVSMDVTEILNRQNQIKKELERSLAKTVANNKRLDEMSRIDALTGISNRRGYMTAVREILSDKRNYGKRAIALYADMDCLKIVNDEFGHDEGDFALCTIARILAESFRKSDVVGRMGGDEFAAFAIVNHDDFTNIVKDRIYSLAKEFNESSDKPYYVNMSVGSCEFIIDEDVHFEHILNEADTNLYEEKRNKTKVVYKNK